MLRRALVFALLGAVVGAGLWIAAERDWFAETEVAAGPAPRDTAAVTVGSLATEFSAEGAIGYASDVTAHVIAPPPTVEVISAGRSVQTVATPASMAVTELVAEGSIVEQGDVLWRLGNEPTVLLYGTEPSYRDLGDGDEGADVLQLETALVALGHDPGGSVTVDGTFTSTTEAMVERWQAAVGATVTGEVAHGAVVYAPAARRVGATDLTIGADAVAGQPGFELQAPQLEITFTVAATDRDTVAIGDEVDVDVRGTSHRAVVSTMTTSADGGADVTAVPIGDIGLESDQAGATVTWTVVLAADVLTVPGESLVRTEDGRYHVEVRDADGTERWVAVTVGASTTARAEVAGDLDPGELVITP